MRRTKIVATIGPASRDPEVLVRMIDAGMDVARLNFSHGSAEEHAETARLVREAAGRAGRQIAILQDLPGPEAADRAAGRRDRRAQARRPPDLRVRRQRLRGRRVGACRSPGPAWPTASTTTRSCTSPTAPSACASTATRPGDGEIDAEVEIGGAVASRQGLNIPGEAAALPAVPEEDLEHVRTGEEIGVDLVALSFVRRAEDITFLRKHTRLPLIAKIEKPQAVAARRGDRARGRLRDGRPRRPRHRAAARGGADRAEAGARAGRRARPPGDHGDPDARLDGPLPAPHARRGDRRRQRDPRRHRRGDALAGERGRRLPRRVGGDAGLDRRRARRTRCPTASGTRSACGATAATPPTRSPTPPAAPPTSSASPRSWSRR